MGEREGGVSTNKACKARHASDKVDKKAATAGLGERTSNTVPSYESVGGDKNSSVMFDLHRASLE